jgi:hypothetical protein
LSHIGYTIGYDMQLHIDNWRPQARQDGASFYDLIYVFFKMTERLVTIPVPDLLFEITFLHGIRINLYFLLFSYYRF